MIRNTTKFRKKFSQGDTTGFDRSSVSACDAVKLFLMAKEVFETLGPKVRTDAILYEKAKLADLFARNDQEVAYELVDKFQKLAGKYGYSYNWGNSNVKVFWEKSDDEKIHLCSHDTNDYDYQRKCNLAVMMHAQRNSSVCDFPAFVRAWPYSGREHLAHYGMDGIRLKGSPLTLPYYAWEFVRNGREANFVRMSPKMSEDLVHLFRVAFANNPFKEVDVADAMEYLRTARINRLNVRDRGAYSKTLMSLVPGRSNNFNKFYDPNVTGVVHHYGSGTVDKLSRYAFPNAQKIICIDPAADGPNDHKLRHDQYNGVNDGDWIISDVAFHEEIVKHYGRVYLTGLDVGTTNMVANEIYKISLKHSSPLIMVVGIQPENEIMFPMCEGRFVIHSKIRLHNAEVVVKKDENGSLLKDIFKRMAYVSRKANEMRVVMDVENIYPSSDYKEKVLDLRPTVFQVVDEIMVNLPWDKPGILRRPVQKDLISDRVLTQVLRDVVGHSTFTIPAGSLEGFNFISAYRYLVDKQMMNFKDSNEIVAALCEYARDALVDQSLTLERIKF